MNFRKLKYGVNLTAEDQRYVLSAYGHRFTREHKPNWACRPMHSGHPYPVQFASDKDWLENTRFQVTKSGRLDGRVRECYSEPTWPDNPELQKPNAQRRLPFTEQQGAVTL